MLAWRNCAASLTLIAEINARWPNRDKTSDGTIGDASHRSRSSASDHNPWIQDNKGVGVVRARDIDKDGINAAWLAEHLRKLGSKGDHRLFPGGYVIFNRRISSPDFSGWRTYVGTNPHEKHVHVSFTTDEAGFDSTAPWGITTASTSTEEIDLTPEQAQQLATLYSQMVTGPAINTTDPWGWPTFDGGTKETLTVVDLLRRANVQLEELKRRIGAVETGKAGPPVLSDADVDRVASQLAEILGKKLAP